ILNKRTLERWTDLNKKLVSAGIPDQWRTFLNGSLDLFQEHFEHIEPFMSQFHPTFVLGLNRIQRELLNRVLVGSNGIPAPGHEVCGALIQLAAIRRHIQWLREVDVQVDKNSDHDFHGAIPLFTKEELITRTVPKAMIEKMEKEEI